MRIALTIIVCLIVVLIFTVLATHEESKQQIINVYEYGYARGYSDAKTVAINHVSINEKGWIVIRHSMYDTVKTLDSVKFVEFYFKTKKQHNE